MKIKLTIILTAILSLLGCYTNRNLNTKEELDSNVNNAILYPLWRICDIDIKGLYFVQFQQLKLLPPIISYRYAGLCVYSSPSSSCSNSISGELYTLSIACSMLQPVSSFTYFTNSLNT